MMRGVSRLGDQDRVPSRLSRRRTALHAMVFSTTLLRAGSRNRMLFVPYVMSLKYALLRFLSHGIRSSRHPTVSRDIYKRAPPPVSTGELESP